jgi:hypothetical protein
MKTILNFFNSLQSENKYEEYLPIFRVFLCLILLNDLLKVWSYRAILYGQNSFIHAEDTTNLFSFFSIDSNIIRNNNEIFFIVYVVLIIFSFFGIGRNLTALGLFLCLELKQRLCYLTLNGGDNILKFILLYMIFTNAYKYYAIRESKKLLKPSSLSNFLTNLSVLSITLHLCLAYLVSAFHKVHSDAWFNGVATYYTFSLERFQGTSFNSILAKNGYFVTISSYMTIIIEMFFPVLIWFKQTKWIMIFLGTLLHVGIFIFMMLYDFQLIFISIYGFFITNAEWITIKKRLKNYKNKVLVLFNNYKIQINEK